MEKIRLQKFFTECGVMSRRSSETEIANGNVKINGITASLGDKVDSENDTVEWNGKIIKKPANGGHTYIMLNKPLGYVTTMNDEKGRKTAAELVCGAGVRVYPVGRLDMYSEGLLIFTDDGELANNLTHPSHEISKVYSVKIKGKITDEALEILRGDMVLDGYKLQKVKVSVFRNGEYDKGNHEYSVLRFTLYEGRNRQIRRMCEKAGVSIMRLCRISEGEVKLGRLESGKWRHLTEEEIKYLKSI